MAKQMKNSGTESKSSSGPSIHPPYFQMISEAITAMKDRTGSSQPAIAKYIDHHYGNVLPLNFRKLLSVQLKRLVQSEKLVKVNNSYKIPAAAVSNKFTKQNSTATDAAGTKDVEKKAQKTKRLSQVRTPQCLKNPKNAV